MKLTDIISISGKPGLFQLLNRTKSPFTAKDLENGRKSPIFPRDNIVSLADISIYTEEEEMPLGEVFEKIKEKFPQTIEGSSDILADKEKLREFMTTVLPIYDKDRVHDGDIKKLIKWYNILRKAGMENFVQTDEELSENTEKTDN